MDILCTSTQHKKHVHDIQNWVTVSFHPPGSLYPFIFLTWDLFSHSAGSLFSPKKVKRSCSVKPGDLFTHFDMGSL